MLIAIDAGHGMDTAGKRTPALPEGYPPTLTGTAWMHEREFNVDVAGKMASILKRCGFDVILAAPEDTPDVPLQTRCARANSAKADLFVSVHANALTGSWGSQNGIETYFYTGSKKGKLAAELIHEQLISACGLSNRGVKTAGFYVLKYTNMPAVLCECGFMDNLSEAKLLLMDSYRQKCAEAIARGVSNYLGTTYIPEPKDNKTIIQEHCNFSYPEGVWAVMDNHPFAFALYQQWADSYNPT